MDFLQAASLVQVDRGRKGGPEAEIYFCLPFQASDLLQPLLRIADDRRYQTRHGVLGRFDRRLVTQLAEHTGGERAYAC